MASTNMLYTEVRRVAAAALELHRPRAASTIAAHNQINYEKRFKSKAIAIDCRRCHLATKYLYIHRHRTGTRTGVAVVRPRPLEKR